MISRVPADFSRAKHRSPTRQAFPKPHLGNEDEKIDTAPARAIYARRLAIVEPVFANLRSNKRLDRFTYRGQARVSVQWSLYCLVHNLEKLAHLSRRYGPQGPLGGRSGGLRGFLTHLLRALGWLRRLLTALRDLFEAPMLSSPNCRLTVSP